LVAEGEFEQRVALTKDQCIVDGKVFFIRGHIELPIVGLSTVRRKYAAGSAGGKRA
jgi:hypothetical protein